MRNKWLALSLLVIINSAYADVQAQAKPEIYQIRRPDVKRAEVPYPYIIFHSYDTIFLEAGGCVQTGGKGLTWKRYLNPSGPNSDKYYYGILNIQGFTANWQHLKDYVNHQYVIPVAANNAILQLGYVDDNYEDNGYYRKDNGTENQCQFEHDAFVKITIRRYSSTK